MRQTLHLRGCGQALRIITARQHLKNSPFKYGDEVEFVTVIFNHKTKTVSLALVADEILKYFLRYPANFSDSLDGDWRPEYGSFMVEAVPARPYQGIADLSLVQNNMYQRRKALQKALKHFLPDSDCDVLSITSFPRLGTMDAIFPAIVPGGEVSDSIFLPDIIINPNPRFSFLTKNIRSRRGSKVNIQIPLFMDTHTNPDIGRLDPASSSESTKLIPNTSTKMIYMDAMGFGMGSSCLQVTFQAPDFQTSRILYDQLAVLASVLLSHSASAPVYRGLLANQDVRWNVISQSVDDRTPEERNPKSKSYLHKSRYDAFSLYLNSDPEIKAANDVKVALNPIAFDILHAAGLDAVLSEHLAHQFTRDPLVVYDFSLDPRVDETSCTYHLDNIITSNWQSVRFKPPPCSTTPQIHWRVEIRTIDIQLSDFANSAYVTFVTLLTKFFITKKHLFYIPVSCADENIRRGHLVNSIVKEKFFFPSKFNATTISESLDSVVETSINEIFNGSDRMTGLVPIARSVLDSESSLSQEQRSLLSSYLDFISLRSSGQIPTIATWMRKFITKHPKYHNDSVVTPEIQYDMLKKTLDFESVANLQDLKIQLCGNTSLTDSAPSESSTSTSTSSD